MDPARSAGMEIPPRVRRRGFASTRDKIWSGNTSACAEKSCMPSVRFSQIGKYLRMCGEEQQLWTTPQATMEIPPRVRRRARLCSRPEFTGGNTSACAEKSYLAPPTESPHGKYLRVCGEETVRAVLLLLAVEIPPRVRRRDTRAPGRIIIIGNTSACAEKSYLASWRPFGGWKYLRVCGEERCGGGARCLR